MSDATMNDSTTTSDPFQTTHPEEVIIVENLLKKRILKQGIPNTQPPKNANVTVHYTGRLTNGTKFDSSVDRNSPFNFKIGQGQVIKGWDQGVATMNKNEKSLLICAPSYAYGAAGSPPSIPPNSTLEFEVELLDWDDMVAVPGTDNQVKKRVLVEVEKDGGFSSPTDGSKVKIEFSMKVGDKIIIENQQSEIIVGEQLDVPKGVESALKKMSKGEKSVFLIQPEWGLKNLAKKPNYLQNLDENSVLEYTIELLDYQNQPETWELSRPQKLERMLHLKTIGNEFFKVQQYKRACEKYSSALELAPPSDEDEDTKDEDRMSDEQKISLKQLELVLYSNKAVCESKMGNWRSAIKECTSALELDDQHAKSWFARGRAYAAIGQYEDAKHDLMEAQKIDGGKLKEIEVELKRVTLKIKQQAQRERKAFGGFFNKVSLVSDEELLKAKEAAENAASTNSFSDSDDEEMEENDKENTDSAANEQTKSDATMQDDTQPTKSTTQTSEAATTVEA